MPVATLDKLLSAWADFSVAMDGERDPGFRDEIRRLTRRGMVSAAFLATFCVAVYIGSYTFTDRPIGFRFGEPRVIVIVDELLIVLTSAILLALSRTEWGLQRGRLLASVLIVVSSAAMMTEDVAGGDVSFTTAYLTLGLVLAVGAFPFRPVQTFALGMTVAIAYAVFVTLVPPILSVNLKTFLMSRAVYLLVLTLLLTAISALLYRSRYEQHRALNELKATQVQLIQSAKMASLGHVTAGIAHEIKNPLNFINNFAELNVDLSRELIEILGGSPALHSANDDSIESLISVLHLNNQKINEQGKRADAIVRSMMLHARGVSGERRSVPLNTLIDEHVTLAHSAIRSTHPDAAITIEREYDEAVGDLDVAPQELGRVLINLLTNAFDAVLEKKATDEDFSPSVSVRTHRLSKSVEIRVRDNGFGIPVPFVNKVFEPFFTTKTAGKGTGLGLSISYDIVVNGHGGMLNVENEEGRGAEFVITLPVTNSRSGRG